MTTDREKVESLLPQLIFKSVVVSSGEQTDGNAQCVAYLDEGMREVLHLLDDKRRASVWRRTLRLHDAIMAPDRKGGVSVEKAGMIGFYLLQAILEAGYLELVEGSKVAVAINAVIKALTGFSEAPLDASARKQAAKALRELQAQGYYDGVTMERDAA